MRFLRSLFTENGREKLLALLVTAAVWAGVVASRDEPIAFTVKVRFDAGPDRIVTTVRLQEEIYVQAKGSIFTVAQVRSEEQEMVIDLRNREPGKGSYFVDERDIPLSRSLKIEQIVPREVVFTISRKISKTVQVAPVIDGQPKKGYRIANVATEPKTVSLEGPEEIIAATDVISTESVSVSDASEKVVRTVALVTGHPHVRVRANDSSAVTVTVSIIRDIREAVFPKVPLVVDGGVATEIVPAVVSVKVRGPIEIIEQLTGNGLTAFVENLPARVYTVERYYFKDLPADLEIVEIEPVRGITVRKK